MTTLSVNLNKILLIRNSREHDLPSIEQAAQIAVEAGGQGLTIHPRSDGRHAKVSDIPKLMAMPIVQERHIEVNVEGDLRTELLEMVIAHKVHQFTIVPVDPGELTSTRGWSEQDGQTEVPEIVKRLQPDTRVSLFIDATANQVQLAASFGVNAVEFHTGAFVEAFQKDSYHNILDNLIECANLAKSKGLRVHLGHDLDRQTLPILIEKIVPDEVSIGHALITEAVLEGLPGVVSGYLAAIQRGQTEVG